MDYSDFTQRPTKATTCRVRMQDCFMDTTMDISRPYCDGMIPITEIDNLLDINLCRTADTYINFGKRDIDMIYDALDMHSSTMSEKYDHRVDNTTKTYTVPIIGFLTTSVTKPTATVHVAVESKEEKFVVIDGNKYSKNKIYRHHKNAFVPVNVPIDYVEATPIINENEQVFRSKSSYTKDIVLNMPVEIELSGLSVHPEPLLFEQIHSTNHCHNRCTKYNHFIKCLKNDPGYLISFKLFVRSSMTNNMWVSLGTFSGNNSICDATRISFDKMLVKQIKIEPISFHNSYKKVQLFPVGPSISAIRSDDMFVTYIITEPGSNQPYDKIDRRFKKYAKHVCKCDTCRSTNHAYKKKCDFIRKAYNDIIV